MMQDEDMVKAAPKASVTPEPQPSSKALYIALALAVILGVFIWDPLGSRATATPGATVAATSTPSTLAAAGDPVEEAVKATNNEAYCAKEALQPSGDNFTAWYCKDRLPEDRKVDARLASLETRMAARNGVSKTWFWTTIVVLGLGLFLAVVHIMTSRKQSAP